LGRAVYVRVALSFGSPNESPAALFNPAGQNLLPSTVLFVFGLFDLLRGVLHTFFVNWAVRTFAKLDLSVAHQDQLTQLGAFGVLLTGVIFILVSIEAAQLSEYFLLTIPCGYVVGAIGMRTSGVKAQSAFYGRYFMMVYLGVLGDVCLVATSSMAPNAVPPTPPDR